MKNKLINTTVLNRLKKAEENGDVKLLEDHLRENYDTAIHKAVYAALVRMGRKSASDKLKECKSI